MNSVLDLSCVHFKRWGKIKIMKFGIWPKGQRKCKINDIHGEHHLTHCLYNILNTGGNNTKMSVNFICWMVDR